jgi:predicted HNH restriction endonuclease
MALEPDPQTMRNPTWNRDELILALDAYVRWGASPPAKNSADIAALSQTMNDLRRVLGSVGNDKLRNANGVYMKLMNFRSVDPAFKLQGKTGLTRGNKLEGVLWAEFHGDAQRLAKVAGTIRAGITEALASAIVLDTWAADDPTEGAEAIEGAIATRMHRTRERSRVIVEKKKASVLKAHGALACEACGFDFSIRYGARGVGFIECHHTKPVETLGDGTPTKLSDLALLCANCHRMIHAKRPWLSVQDLQQSLR